MIRRTALVIAAVVALAPSTAGAQGKQTVRLSTIGLELDLPTLHGIQFEVDPKDHGRLTLRRGGALVGTLAIFVTDNCRGDVGLAPHAPLIARGWERGIREVRKPGTVSFGVCKLLPGRWPGIAMSVVAKQGSVTDENLFDLLDAIDAAVDTARNIPVARLRPAAGNPNAKAAHPRGWTFDLTASPNNWVRGNVTDAGAWLSRRGPAAGVYSAYVQRLDDDLEAVVRCAPLASSERPAGKASFELRPGVFIPVRSGGGKEGTDFADQRKTIRAWKGAWVELCAADEQGRVYIVTVHAGERGVRRVPIDAIADVTAALANTVFGSVAPPPVSTTATTTATTTGTATSSSSSSSSSSSGSSYSYQEPSRIRTRYGAEYRSTADPSLVGDMDGAVVASVTSYLGLTGWATRFHAELGFGIGGGMVYDFGGEFGLGAVSNRGSFLVLAGVDYSGITGGKIGGHSGFPFAVELTARLTRGFSLVGRGAVRVVLSDQMRGDGSSKAPFGDELMVLGGVRLGPQGWIVGVTYREQVGTSFTGFSIATQR